MTEFEVLRDYFATFMPTMREDGYLPRNEDEEGWHRGATYVCTQALALIDQLEVRESKETP